MNTELVVKTSGTGWTTSYTYNVYVSESDAAYNASANTYLTVAGTPFIYICAV